MKSYGKKLLITGIILGIVGGIGAYLKIKKVGSPVESGKVLSSDTQKDVLGFSVEDFDWQLGKGARAEALRPMLADSLFEYFPDGLRINRLASDVRIRMDDGSALVTIRDSAYWSDGTQITSDHFANALDRAKGALMREGTITDEVELKWLRAVRLTIIDRLRFKLVGITEASWYQSILGSRLMTPIRQNANIVFDEIKGEIPWAVTPGKYALPSVSGFPLATITLIPNRYYYRGVAPSNVALKSGEVELRTKE